MKSETRKPMDKIVLARLTGKLGDAQTIARCCSDVAALECLLLGDMIREELQLDIDLEYASHKSGLTSTLIGSLGSGYTLSSVSLRNWCPHFVVGAKNDLPIAMIAQLLGDTGSDVETDTNRDLSAIETDIASLLLDRVVSVLRCGVEVPDDYEPVLSKPYAASRYAHQAAEFPEEFAGAIRLNAKLGNLTSEIVLVIPQQVLLKTTITKPTSQPANDGAGPEEPLADHILRSQVDLCARIKLTPLKLGSISRLRPGDVIPFEDIGEIFVDMDANGKTMYRCEFGRSGNNYSVKVKSNSSADGNILKQILNI